MYWIHLWDIFASRLHVRQFEIYRIHLGDILDILASRLHFRRCEMRLPMHPLSVTHLPTMHTSSSPSKSPSSPSIHLHPYHQHHPIQHHQYQHQCHDYNHQAWLFLVSSGYFWLFLSLSFLGGYFWQFLAISGCCWLFLAIWGGGKRLRSAWPKIYVFLTPAYYIKKEIKTAKNIAEMCQNQPLSLLVGERFEKWMN